jgi:hypothetical protein
MISRRETSKARLLDAEMQLQRAWLELNLRELQQGSARSTGWRLGGLNLSGFNFDTFSLGSLGLSFLKHRSWWLAGAGLLINLYRRHVRKEKATA